VERRFLFHLIRFFRIRGASEKVARGFSLGLIVNFFPTFGFGVLISGVFARLFGGNAIAGLAGGALLTFFWPVLFYLNMRTGGFFLGRSRVSEFEEVVVESRSALVWGQTFTVGAIANSLLVGLCIYLLLRILYGRTRPAALAYFRRHARDHQRRFRRPRLALT
jgi:uncharacterized protein (DUF2062 family)